MIWVCQATCVLLDTSIRAHSKDEYLRSQAFAALEALRSVRSRSVHGAHGQVDAARGAYVAAAGHGHMQT